ncbi:hypothetical protein ANN_21503 [Periplaneta americana]|uniref:Uncharacterized protein n=1 Tax=Periplaneta americana TaxID=6978 RepID=A0ABQ8SFG6_PERAM|nr:hypothetical protein ANN_21503 [Periplaneta americana]
MLDLTEELIWTQIILWLYPNFDKISNHKNVNTHQVNSRKIVKFNIEVLKNEKTETLYKEQKEEQLRNRKNDTTANNVTINEQWNEIKNIITRTAVSVLGEIDKPERNHWFDEECELVTQEKNLAYTVMLQRGCTKTI